MPWDYSTIYWNFSVAFFVHTAHGCLIQMCHQNYSRLSGTFFAGEILILYRANSRFRVPPGSNLNLSLMTVKRVTTMANQVHITHYMMDGIEILSQRIFSLICNLARLLVSTIDFVITKLTEHPLSHYKNY